jgi:hypothetical protein
VVSKQADGLQLVVGEQMRFLDDQDRDTTSLRVFGGERVGGLWREGGVMGQRLPPREAMMRWWIPRTPTVGSGR